MNPSQPKDNSVLFGSGGISAPGKSVLGSLVSIVIHALALAALLVIPYVLTSPQTKSTSVIRRTPLIAPLKPSVPRTPPLVVSEPIHPKPVLLPPPVLPPPVVTQVVTPVAKPVEIKPEPAPVIVAHAPVAPPPIAPQPIAPPIERKRPATEEVFAAAQPVNQRPAKARETHVGEFGDVHGATPADSKQSLLTKVGGFDTPSAAPVGGSNRRMAYQETSFGSAAQVGARASAGAAVKTGGFGDASAGPVTQSARAKQIEEKPTPVEILAKPKPIYTEEARQLKVEGDVTLEVVFLASGGIQVVRVVHGLGHGLDEVAVRVAKDIHFRPSTVHGVAVDSKAIIHVTFELT